jgi:hypothetical protein
MQLSEGALLTIAGGIATALVTAMGKLWLLFVKSQEAQAVKQEQSEARLQGQLDKCEESHRSTNQTLIEMNRKIGELEGREKAFDKVADQIHQLHDTMLSEIRATRNEPPGDH